jgi:hypothetical protein
VILLPPPFLEHPSHGSDRDKGDWTEEEWLARKGRWERECVRRK